MDDIGGIVKGIVIFAVVIGVLGSIAAIGVAFWPVWLALGAAVIGGRIYWKRHKRAQNMV
jgi:hypothetical protein